jgi:hypothetical protein
MPSSPDQWQTFLPPKDGGEGKAVLAFAQVNADSIN